MSTQLILKHRSRKAFRNLMSTAGFTFICVAAAPLCLQITNHAIFELVSIQLWASMITAVAISVSRLAAVIFKVIHSPQGSNPSGFAIALIYMILIVFMFFSSTVVIRVIWSTLPEMRIESLYLTLGTLIVATLCQFFPMLLRPPDPADTSQAPAIPPQNE